MLTKANTLNFVQHALWTSLVLILMISLFCPVQHVFSQSIRIVFLHHSCGHNLIEQGSVRQGLTALGYAFFDHGYNGDGLRLADGSYSGENFDVPGDNTDPDGLAEIFSQPLNSPPDNTFSHLMQYDVIAFKSCFPSSNISSDDMLRAYQAYYLSMRDRMDQYPEKIFIIVTQPPQVPNNTDRDEGRRARAFVQWLQSDEYLSGHDNIFVFDFFGQLAGDDNFLRREYRVDNWDAHPNDRANQDIGPRFVSFIDESVRSYDGIVPQPETVESQSEDQQQPEAVEDTAPGVVPVTTSGLIDDFELSTEPWESYMDGAGSSIACVPDDQYSYSGEHAMIVNYEINPGGWAGCEKYLGNIVDFSQDMGLSFALRSASAGQDITITLNTGDPDVAVYPYEVHLITTGESEQGFVPYYFAWDAFKVPEWSDPSAPASLDPTAVISVAINFGSESGQEGTFWIDQISLGQMQGVQSSTDGSDDLTEVQPGDQASPLQKPQGVGGFLRGLCPLSTALIPLTLGLAAFVFLRKQP